MSAQSQLLGWLIDRAGANDYDAAQARALLAEGWPEAETAPPPPAAPTSDTVTVPAGTQVIFTSPGGGSQ